MIPDSSTLRLTGTSGITTESNIECSSERVFVNLNNFKLDHENKQISRTKCMSALYLCCSNFSSNLRHYFSISCLIPTCAICSLLTVAATGAAFGITSRKWSPDFFIPVLLASQTAAPHGIILGLCTASVIALSVSATKSLLTTVQVWRLTPYERLLNSHTKASKELKSLNRKLYLSTSHHDIENINKIKHLENHVKELQNLIQQTPKNIIETAV